MGFSLGRTPKHLRSIRGPVSHAVLFLAALSGLVVPGPAWSGTLPAYAHNDYRNRRPLWDALGRGYRGVEVDVFLVDDQLLLGHDRDEAAAGASFEERYLQPLRKRIDRLGSVHGDNDRFLLNIELKEQDPVAFAELRRLLSKYSTILTTVIDGVEHVGPVRVVLVGWHPPIEELLRIRVRNFGIQRRSADLRLSRRDGPAHLCPMISMEFRELSRWNGVGQPPRRFRERMQRFNLARQRIPDRIVRVFEVPRSRAVYRELLASGVDYIGTKTIEDTQILLNRIGEEEPKFTWGR